MTTREKIAGVDAAAEAIFNQYDTMAYERWLAEKRLRAYRAEIARRAAAATQ